MFRSRSAVRDRKVDHCIFWKMFKLEGRRTTRARSRTHQVCYMYVNCTSIVRKANIVTRRHPKRILCLTQLSLLERTGAPRQNSEKAIGVRPTTPLGTAFTSRMARNRGAGLLEDSPTRASPGDPSSACFWAPCGRGGARHWGVLFFERDSPTRGCERPARGSIWPLSGLPGMENGFGVLSRASPSAHQDFCVSCSQICLRQSSRFHVIISAFPDHSRTEQVSDVSCLSRGMRRAPASDEAPR